MRRNQHGIDHILVHKNDFLRKIQPARLLSGIFKAILLQTYMNQCKVSSTVRNDQYQDLPDAGFLFYLYPLLL